jgi:exportin-7
MYPGNIRAVLCCLEAFADTPAVTTPLLKFVSEFVFNKSQRLTFDSSSPNGILLFREVREGISHSAVACCTCVQAAIQARAPVFGVGM